MTVPSSNILAQALTVIGTTPVQYYAFSARTANAIGLDVSTYAEPVEMRGSVQPVPRSLYDQLGLDLQKSYLMIYSLAYDVGDVERDTSGDLITVFGKTWQAESKTNWFPIDGWNGILFVDVSPVMPNYLCPLPEIGGTADDYLASLVDQSHPWPTPVLSSCGQYITRVDNFESTIGDLSVTLRSVTTGESVSYVIYIDGVLSVSGSTSSNTPVVIFNNASLNYANPCAFEMHLTPVAFCCPARGDYVLIAEAPP